jgi:hypothetical protein
MRSRWRWPRLAATSRSLRARSRRSRQLTSLSTTSVSAIGFVVRLRIGQRLRRALGAREEADARILVEQIVAHLERCRFRFSQEPPCAPPSTPDVRCGGSDQPPPEA